MTSSNEEDEADVFKMTPPIREVFKGYFKRLMKNLPSFTGQIAVLFCVLPVSFAIAVFLVTAIGNFGIAFIAQTISSVIILLFLIPSLVVCIVSAVATAYILQITQSIYFGVFHPLPSHSNTSKISCPISSTPPPEYLPSLPLKLEIKEKQKTC